MDAKHQVKKPEAVESLHERLLSALQRVTDDNKEPIAYQLHELMVTLERADFPIRIRLQMAVTLVEQFVDPEIIR